MQLSENQLFDSRYRLVELIGRGASAEVWKAVDTKAGDMLVAVKIYKPDTLGPGSAGIAEFQREFTMVYNMTHTNLLHPQGFDICEGSPYLVMAFCENGSATTMIGRFDENDLLQFLRDVSAGLEYLHDHNITHQDIKPDNILVDDNCSFMVTDFGISRKGANDAIGGTRAYMAPEVYRGKPEHASDIWSLGATAVELINGQPPYGDLGGAAQAQNPALPPFKGNISEPVKKMIEQMLDPDPRKRPSASSIRTKIDHFRETGSWNRNVQRNKIAYITAAVMSVLLCAGLAIWDYNRTKVRYYNDYVDVWGVPEGLGVVSSFDQKHRAHTIRMEYKRGKLRNVKTINAQGNLTTPGETELADRYTNADFFYTNDGNIDYIKVYNQSGECMYVMDFDANLKTILFKSDDEHGTEKPLKGKTSETSLALNGEERPTTPITRYLVTYDDKGHYSKIEYATYQNQLVSDDDMVHGIIFEYDDNGLLQKKSFIGIDGSVTGNKRGLAYKEYEYDDHGRWIGLKYYTVDGGPSSDGTLVPYFRHELDKYGNVISESYFTLDGEPMLRTDEDEDGARYISGHKFVYELNSDGTTAKLKSYGIDGEPFTLKYGFAGYIYEYDENGYQTKTTFINAEDSVVNMINNANGTNASTVVKNNDKGLPLEVAYFDRFGDPVENASGVHKFVLEYDSVGHLTSSRFLDKESKPKSVNNYQAGYNDKYDSYGNLIEENYVDTEGKLINNSDGYAIVRKEYDLAGHVTKDSFFGPDNKPVLCNNRYSSVTYEYDQRGNQIKISFFDAEGKPINCAAGHHYVLFEYDPKTNFNTAIKRFNVNGAPVSSDYSKYDNRGNVIEYRPLGADGRLASGSTVSHYEWNNNNRMTRSWNTDLNGNKVVEPGDKYCETRYKYDQNGNITEATFWSASGSPVNCNDGSHRIVKEYNNLSQLVKWFNYDVSGNPIKASQSNNAPEAHYQYDDRGNELELTVYDGYGKAINSSMGWHKRISKYDDKNNNIEIAYFDVSGAPANDKDKKYSRSLHDYNDHGKIIKNQYFSNGKLIRVEEYKYNDRDNATEVLTHDGNGKPLSDYFYKLVQEYESDNITPKKLSYYLQPNQLYAWQIWNKEKKDWGDPQFASGGMSAAAPAQSYGGGSSWQDEFREIAAQCPVDYDSDVTLQSVSVSSSSVTVTIKLRNISKYELNDAQMSEIRSGISELRNTFRSELPSNVSLYIEILDKAGRKLPI